VLAVKTRHGFRNCCKKTDRTSRLSVEEDFECSDVVILFEKWHENRHSPGKLTSHVTYEILKESNGFFSSLAESNKTNRVQKEGAKQTQKEKQSRSY
jgi:hypothetical protein